MAEPTPAPRAGKESYIFVSYASRDRERMLAIVGRLQAAGVRVWLDQRDISGATIYGNEIVEGIKNCAVFVIMCSRTSLVSRNVRQEIQLAWKYERPYLPLMLEPVTVPQELEYWLEGWQWLAVHGRPEAEWRPQVLEALTRHGLRLDGATGATAELVEAAAVVTADPAAATAASAENLAPKRSPWGRGRRLVTVLSAEVTGVDALGKQMDPEEAKLVVSDVRAAMVAAVARYEGYVARLAPNGISAFFGAPIAHEDDAERAARAAKAIGDQTRSLADEVRAAWGVEDFAVRMGLHTAPLELDEPGTDPTAESGVGSDAVALARAIGGAAPPHGLLASAATHRQLRRRFECRAIALDAGDASLQGIELFEVLRPAAARRPAASGDAGATALVGRGRELDALHDALEALAEGQGQVVAVVGEAGIGKSRLVEEAQAAFRRDATTGQERADVRWLEGRALSYGQSLSLWPIAQLLKADMGVADGDPDARVRMALRRRLQALFGDGAGEVLPVLGHLLGVKLEGEAVERIRRLEGENLKIQTIAIVEDYLRRLAEDRPAVLVFEDLHWADPSTIEAIASLLSLTDEAPLMVLLVFRPERNHGSWRLKMRAETDFGHRYTEVGLKPLSTDETVRLVEALIEGGELPERIRAMVLDRAEGNPFYAEEIVRSLIEQGALACDLKTGAWHETIPDVSAFMPDTLQGVLLARIDRLNEDVRETLQLAAVIGRTFLQRVLVAASEPGAPLHDHIAQLQRADLVREKTRRPELEHVFKHSLIQGAAYQSLGARQKRELHARVGRALEQLFGDRLDEFCGLLAHHFAAAGECEPAMAYAIRAGRRAAESAALREALDFFGTALELAPLDAIRDDALEGKAKALLDLFRGRDALATYEELLQSARERGDRTREIEALIGMGRACYVISLDDASAAAPSRDYLEQAYALAREAGDKARMVRALTPTNHFVDYWPEYRAQASANLDEALTLSEELGDEVLLAEVRRRRLRFLTEPDQEGPGEELLAWLEERQDLVAVNEQTFWMMWLHFRRGNFQRCVECCDAGVALAVKLGVPPVQYASIKAMALVQMGRYDEAWTSLQREVADETHPFGQAMQRYAEGYYLFDVMAYNEAIEALRDEIARARALGRAWMRRGALMWLTKALARTGRLDAETLGAIEADFADLGPNLPGDARAEANLAEGALDDALRLAEKAAGAAAADGRRPERLVAEELRLRVLLALNRPSDALGAANEALALAEEIGQGSLAWRIRRARGLAHGMLGDGAAAERDLAEARELMLSLAATIPDPNHRAAFETESGLMWALESLRRQSSRSNR